MNFIKSKKIDGVVLIEPKIFGDDRGNFFESYSKGNFAVSGIKNLFVQDNQSFSAQVGTLRGLHIQLGQLSQAKLVRVTQGRVFDVVVDVRPKSPTFGQWESYELSSENNYQLFIPRHFLHGFMTLTPDVIFSYKCDNYYNKSSESGIIWNDPDLSINWPLDVEPVLSDKDKLLPRLREWMLTVDR